MLSIGRMTAGAGYEYLTREVATSRHDYYAGRGERAGVWWGEGLGRLGLAGEVTTEQMAALYGQALDPETGEALGRRFPIYRPLTERVAEAVEAWTAEHGRPPQGDQLVALRARLSEAPQRQAIAALDLTFSPVKSVSALWAIAGDEMRAEIEAAHDAAVTAALGHLQDVAGVTRAGVNGVRTVDAEGWIVARFTHRMSRTADPQLHTHCAVLNRVYCATDGRWRTLDSRAIYRLAAGGGGIYTRVLEDGLTARLGVAWRDLDTNSPTPRRELAGMPQDLTRGWSKRRLQVEDQLGDLETGPRSAKARAIAAQQATLRSRPAKGTPEATPHDRWRAEAQALDHDPDELVDQVAPGPSPPAPGGPGAGANIEPETPGWLELEEVLDQAVERLEATSSTWRRGNLVRAVAEALPAQGRSADRAAALVDELVDRVERSGRLLAIAAPEPVEVPVELQRRDGTSVYRPAAGMRWTTPGILAAEARIVETARETDPSLALEPGRVEAVLAQGPRHGLDYGDDQADAVRTLCSSGRRLELLIGAAGTGKTTTMRAVVDAWTGTRRRVIGLAVAETAARVLAEETDCQAHNIARWLTMGEFHPDDPAWQLGPGDLLLVDEVGMVTTGVLDTLRRQAVEAGAKLVGVGDPLQLGPVGAGGAARLVATDVDEAASYLHELHRFTHDWEAAASLGLRDGDADIAHVYDAHGRLHGGDRDSAPAGAQQAWLNDYLAGRDSLLLAVSRSHVADMAGWCRDQLVERGLVDDQSGHSVTLHDNNQASAGDLVVTRLNARIFGVANRDVWEVEHVDQAGTLAVRHATRGQSAILPAGYVADHVELAYAATVHAAQGRTVDTAHVVGAMGIDRELLYVAMTRGRDANHAYLVTEDFLHEEFGGGRVEAPYAMRAIIDQDPAVTSATEALRGEMAAADSLATWGPIAEDLDVAVTRRRALAYLEHRYGTGIAGDVDSDPAAGAFVALVHRSPTVGVDVDRMLRHVCQRDLTGADSNAQVLAARTRRALQLVGNGRLSPSRLPDPPADWKVPGGAIERYRIEVEAIMDQRARTLGEITAAEAAPWAVDQWGPVPDDPVARAVWVQAAGEVAAYRERWAIDATPGQLAETTPPTRDVARWRHWQDIRGWLDLDANGIADRYQTGPDADRNELDDRTQTGPDWDRNRIEDELDAALADIRAANEALDQQPAPPPRAPDVGPEPPAPEPPGPDLGL